MNKTEQSYQSCSIESGDEAGFAAAEITEFGESTCEEMRVSRERRQITKVGELFHRGNAVGLGGGRRQRDDGFPHVLFLA